MQLFFALSRDDDDDDDEDDDDEESEEEESPVKVKYLLQSLGSSH